ncbi:Fructosamine-3-kinase, putative [Penicillium digitatum]|uniref:Fructosamine-3-kinase, putative n=1 Tax=Penicillium digitatum TaxID=36651 RepID=A0A7T7BK72_PENDI|nr:Fructosamine-3-kinase, putative [Penicillium digitatum]
MSKLHTTPVPLDLNTGRRRFGFPVPIFCGNTKQPNQVCDSWAEFYANERLLAILATIEERSDPDTGLLYTSSGEGKDIVPFAVQGDLSSGNADWGRTIGSGGDEIPEDVVYDPSACYGHNEYNLMIHLFGSRSFDQYHWIVPKTEPVAEYADRVELYEL